MTLIIVFFIIGRTFILTPHTNLESYKKDGNFFSFYIIYFFFTSAGNFQEIIPCSSLKIVNEGFFVYKKIACNTCKQTAEHH